MSRAALLRSTLSFVAAMALPGCQAVDDEAPRHDARVTFTRSASRGLVGRFERGGLDLAGKTYSARIALRCIGREGACARAPVSAPTLTERDGRVVAKRGPTTEWYVDRMDGVEQGFDLEVRPPGDDELIVALGVEHVVPRVASDGRSAALLAGETAVVSVSALHAYDADGRELPSRMTASSDAGSSVLELRIDDRGARYPIVVDPLYGAAPAKLTGSDAAIGDQASAVAVDGDTVVLGAPRSNGGRGAAYVFVRSGSGWTEQAKLVASDGAPGAGFAQSVAISGDTIAVGSPGKTIGLGTERGQGYVFVRSGTAWTEQAILTSANGGAYDFLGTSAAIAGDSVVFGAPGENTEVSAAGLDGGAAHVFVRSGNTWSLQARLIAPEVTQSARLGGAAAIAGDTVVLGAIGAEVAGKAEAGAARVFVRSGGAWTHQTKLVASDGAPSDQLGASVAIWNDTVVVGAANANPSGKTGAGVAYVFARSGTAWAEEQKLVLPNAASTDLFGASVAACAGRIVVGAPQAELAGKIDSGAAFVFTQVGSTWTEQGVLGVAETAANDRFGHRLACSGDDVVAVGNLADGPSKADTGAAFAYRLAPTRANGAACALAIECTSGFCVDGMCCDAACAAGCMACTAARKGSGVDGVCAPVAVDTDPKGACAVDVGYPASCKADGLCDGLGGCRVFAKAATACGAAPSCASDTLAGKGCKGDSAECVDMVTDCTPFRCAGAACSTTCVDDTACAQTAYCAGAKCVPKLKNAAQCTANRECASEHCVDGVCCDTGCTGQCEYCAEPGSFGTCTPVKGAPRNGRAGCATKDEDCAGSCDGLNGGSCLFPAGKACDSACAAGRETVSRCDKSGDCLPEAAVSCGGYVCNGTDECRTSCGSASDCAAKFACVAGRCEPATSTCSADGAAVVASDGVASPCGTTRCRAGACIEVCSSTDDCASSYVCNVGACTPAAPAEESGGCGFGRTRSDLPAGGLALVALVALVRRRAWRRRFASRGTR